MGYKSAHQRTLLIDPRFQLKYAGWMLQLRALASRVPDDIWERMWGSA